MSYFLLYIILMLDTWCAASISLVVICIMILIVDIIGWLIILDDTCVSENVKKSIKKVGKIAFITFIISFVFATFCPTTKQAATIYLLPKLASNKSMQQLPSKTAELLLKEVKKEINTLNDIVPVVPSNVNIKTKK